MDTLPASPPARRAGLRVPPQRGAAVEGLPAAVSGPRGYPVLCWVRGGLSGEGRWPRPCSVGPDSEQPPTRLQPPVPYPLPAGSPAAFGGPGQLGSVAGGGWLALMLCFQPPAKVSPGSSSSSPCDQLGDQHTHLCCMDGETEARGGGVVRRATATGLGSRHSGPAVKLCHPPVWGWGRCPWCLPGPVPLRRGRLGAPCPRPGSSAALAHSWVPCPARQLSRPVTDGRRALFCIINNVFGKLKTISAIALNFNLIPSRGLAAARGSLAAHGKWSLPSSVRARVGAGSVRPLG